MTFREAVESVLRQYATFSGRAPRSEFWWFYLFSVLVGICCGVVDAVLGTDLLVPLASLALLLPSLAVTSRRLHDSNRTAWWILGFFLGGFVGTVAFFFGLFAWLFAGLGQDDGLGAAGVTSIVLGIVVLLVTFIVQLVLMLAPGTPGPNRFGPGPHQPVTGSTSPSRAGA